MYPVNGTLSLNHLHPSIESLIQSVQIELNLYISPKIFLLINRLLSYQQSFLFCILDARVARTPSSHPLAHNAMQPK